MSESKGSDLNSVEMKKMEMTTTTVIENDERIFDGVNLTMSEMKHILTVIERDKELRQKQREQLE